MSNSSQNGSEATEQQDRIPQQFERNRYFHGKLMTARDMQAEQKYHRTRLETVSRHVTGTGVVCGLGIEITSSDDANSPVAKVGAGIALDAKGRLIVVTEDTDEPIPRSNLGERGVSVYVEQTTCMTESVPAAGSEDACNEECDYNRLRETYEITFSPGAPGEGSGSEGTLHQKSVPIADLDFPASAAFGPDETNGEESNGDGITEHDAVLQRLAQSYHAQQDDSPGVGSYRSCASPGGDRVFLGYFQRTDGEWELARTEEGVSAPRPHVYTNDMLYAGLVGHAADFGNPHEVALEAADAGEVDAQVTTKDSGSTDAAVELHSPDSSIDITPEPDKRVNFELSDELREGLDALGEIDPGDLQELINRTEDLDTLLERSEEIQTLLDRLDELQSVPDRLDEIEERLDNIEASLGRIDDVEDSVADFAAVRGQLVDLAENRDTIMSLANNQQTLASLANNEQILTSLAENEQALTSLVDKQSQLTSLAENQEAITSLAGNETQLRSLAENQQAITSLAENETQLRSLANNETQLTSLAQNGDSLVSLANNSGSIGTVLENTEGVTFDDTILDNS